MRIVMIMAMAAQTCGERLMVDTSDPQYFGEYYDHIKKVTATAEQRKVIQVRYLDRGTDGLKTNDEQRQLPGILSCRRKLRFPGRAVNR